ncbi:MAG: hypothetical protein ACFFDC_19105 [Promethearchaeota archaeon]
MKKNVYKQNKSSFLFLLVFTLILYYNILYLPIQAINWPVSREKKFFSPSLNIDVPTSMKSKSSRFNGLFMIHYLTTPTVLTSFGKESLKGMVTIQWAASTDSLGQAVTYSLFYSPNYGSTWIPVTSDLTTTTYTWNTTNVPDCTNYKLKLVAISQDGLTSENILEEIFSVNNTPPPPPDFSIFIIGLAMISVIPELYLGKRLSKALYRKREEGVS